MIDTHGWKPGAYALVWAGSDGVPVVTVEDPLQAIVETVPGRRWERRAGLKRWVDDDGPWPPQSKNLFVPFFTTKPGGSGIGLVLCRQIAEAHDGTITLEPAPGGRGSRATLALPL